MLNFLSGFVEIAKKDCDVFIHLCFFDNLTVYNVE